MGLTERSSIIRAARRWLTGTLARPDAAPSRVVSRPSRRVVAELRAVRFGPAIRPTQFPAIRPTQFIGVLPADIFEENAR